MVSPGGWKWGAMVCALGLAACSQPPNGADFHVASCELQVANVVEKTRCAAVSDSLFRSAEVVPLLGRGFLEDDYRGRNPSVLLLSYAAWQRRFGGAPGIIGRVIHLNGGNSTVVGVLPRIAYIASSVDVWTPRPSDSK